MAKLKFIDLLSLTRLILFLGVLLLISCTKRIKEVKIITYDLVEQKGIPGITLYLESGETLTTDENGEAVLTSLGDLTGRLIGIPSFLDEYGDAGLKENCEPTTTYRIESHILTIPFRKKSVFTVEVEDKANSTTEGCVIFSDIECVGEVGSQIKINSNGSLDLPRFNQGKAFSHPIYPNSSQQEVRVYFGADCDYSGEPDTSFTFPVSFGDTNFIKIAI